MYSLKKQPSLGKRGKKKRERERESGIIFIAFGVYLNLLLKMSYTLKKAS